MKDPKFAVDTYRIDCIFRRVLQVYRWKLRKLYSFLKYCKFIIKHVFIRNFKYVFIANLVTPVHRFLLCPLFGHKYRFYTYSDYPIKYICTKCFRVKVPKLAQLLHYDKYA